VASNSDLKSLAGISKRQACHFEARCGPAVDPFGASRVKLRSDWGFGGSVRTFGPFGQLNRPVLHHREGYF
jgi:hypothetical protein